MAIESNTIGELINECYAFPYSKLYYEMCKAAAEESLRAQYLESYAFWNCIEGTPLDESGPSSDPDFYIGSDESMYESAMASIYDYDEVMYESYDDDEVMYESSDDDRKGPGVLRKGAHFIKKIFKKFINGVKKILFGVKEDEKKIKAAISNVTEQQLLDHEYTEQEVDNIIYALTNGKGDDKDALNIWAPRTFGNFKVPGIAKGVFDFKHEHTPNFKRATGVRGAIERARHGAPSVASAARLKDLAFRNFIDFLITWKNNSSSEFRFHADEAFDNYSSKYGTGYTRGSNKKITGITIITENLNLLVEYSDSVASIPANLKTSQDSLQKNGISITMEADALDKQIKELTELQENISNVSYEKMGENDQERVDNIYTANTHSDTKYTDSRLSAASKEAEKKAAEEAKKKARASKKKATSAGGTKKPRKPKVNVNYPPLKTAGQVNYIRDYTNSQKALVEAVGATLYAYTWLKQRLDELVSAAKKVTSIVDKAVNAKEIKPEKNKI